MPLSTGLLSTPIADWVTKWNATITELNAREITITANTGQFNVGRANVSFSSPTIVANTSLISPAITGTTYVVGPTVRATTLLNARVSFQLGPQTIANTATIWTNANHGAGSGLNADSVDGQHANFFSANNATLFSIRSLGTAADRVLYTTGVSTFAEANVTTFGRSLWDDADASAARTTLGLGTSDAPQFGSINLGAASDTTLTRTGAGDIAVEGNAIYRAGGTDVPVTDGGTGASTAADAATNLGLGTGSSPQFTAINLGHASDTTITRVSAGLVAVEGVNLIRTSDAATESAAGIVELATTVEAAAGVDTTRAVTSAGVAAAMATASPIGSTLYLHANYH